MVLQLMHLAVPQTYSFLAFIIVREIGDDQGDVVRQFILDDFKLEKGVVLILLINPLVFDGSVLLFGHDVCTLFAAIPGKNIILGG